VFARLLVVEFVFFIYPGNRFFTKALGKQVKLSFFPKVGMIEILGVGGLGDFLIF
jgi:hypothetical protein